SARLLRRCAPRNDSFSFAVIASEAKQSPSRLPRDWLRARDRLQSRRNAARETAMTEFSYDHVHLRSPDPDETARYYERMFGAEVIKSVMSNGVERTDMRLGGVMLFIAQAPAYA